MKTSILNQLTRKAFFMPQIKSVLFVFSAMLFVFSVAHAEETWSDSRFESEAVKNSKAEEQNRKAADEYLRAADLAGGIGAKDPNLMPKPKIPTATACDCVECATALGLKCDQSVEGFASVPVNDLVANPATSSKAKKSGISDHN